jgi:hypothetical protein
MASLRESTDDWPIQYADERRSQERDLNHDAWRTKNLGRDDLLYHSRNKCLIFAF